MNASNDHLELGQFIPLIYHYNMLSDQMRMNAFKDAIALGVPQGARVLELGGGTGVLSFFAAQRAAKVWCVEMNPEMVAAARRLLVKNPCGERVEVVQADAYEYLPPEPVDVVICEMLHVGMLREKQIPVIESFKRRYQEKFGGPLPRFIPEAFIHAVQPVQQSYDYHGYHAPCPLFQDASTEQPRTQSMGDPAVYQLAAYADLLPTDCCWQGELAIAQRGEINALRFITKNVLTIDETSNQTVDWFNQYLVVPLDEPIAVEAGQKLAVAFAYRAGSPIAALQPTVTLIG